MSLLIQSRRRSLLLALVVVTTTIPLPATLASNGGFTTDSEPMIVGDSTDTSHGWKVAPLLTIGETSSNGRSVNAHELGYEIPGNLDGIGAFRLNNDTVRVLVNHELGVGSGYSFQLANGLDLTGARISYFDINPNDRKVMGGGLAFDTIYGRDGTVVDELSDLDDKGLSRFCSGSYWPANLFGLDRGFADPIYLTNEEGSSSADGPGGTHFALDPATKTLWALPDLGRGSWENAALLDTGRQDTVALLLADDHGASAEGFAANPAPPLYLYVGKKAEGGTFPQRNGLVGGQLYVWKAMSGVTDPSGGFNGTGDVESGYWEPLTVNKGAAAGYTADGYATDATLRRGAAAMGAFQFSRPEDIATNPENGTQAVMASTGRADIFDNSDVWGSTYLIDVDFVFHGAVFDPVASNTELTVLYDGDDPGNMQEGLRSPDNVDWADDGRIYVQEDDSAGFAIHEASVWRLNPKRPGSAIRILEMDRNAVPTGQIDEEPGDVGRWESSGVLDVTSLFKTRKGETLLILDVQAHSLTSELIAGAGLVDGGQLLFASHRRPLPRGRHR